MLVSSRSNGPRRIIIYLRLIILAPQEYKTKSLSCIGNFSESCVVLVSFTRLTGLRVVEC